ncbi:MAG TPA: GGDEF domain-containing protein [Acidobacteriaceae bacterium]|nr:GGDEF domain-containing protein [Acidobacteriaceae bacterium]
MDGPYILFGYAVALVLVLIGFAVVRRSVPELRGIRRLSLFILCGIAALFLLAARDRVPALLSLVVANSLLLFGPLFFYAAAAEILGVRARGLRWLTALSIAGVAILFWSSLIHPQILVRLVAHGIIIGTIFVAAAVLLFRNRDVSVGTAARASAWFATVMAALEFAWLSYPWILGIRPNLQHPDPIDAAFSYLAMILALAAVGALSWLSLCVHRRDLEHMAQTDSLTGLLNRGAFEAVLRRDLERCNRSGASIGVMLLDLDYFKQINDSFGHAIGDRVLRRISATLSAGIRPSDVLSRYGGEEFVILLRQSGVEDAQAAAERLRSDVEALEDLPEGIRMTASIGVAVSLPGDSPDGFLLRADEALYRSKKEGRNLVTLYRSPRRGTVVSM